MRTKWLGCCGLLGFVVCLMLLSPDAVDGQQQPPGGFGGFGSGGKGKGKKGSFGDPSAYGGSQYGSQYGGQSFSIQVPQGGGPGSFGSMQQPGGPRGYTFTPGGPGGDRSFGGGGDRGFGPGGPGGKGDRGFGPGGMGGRGGMPGFGPDQIFDMLAKQSGGTDTINFDKLPAETKMASRMMAERRGTQPLPETGTWNRAQFMEHYARSQAMAGDRGGRGPGGPGNYGDMNRSWNDPGNNWGGDPRDFTDRGGDRKGDRDRKDEKKEPPVFAVRYGKLPDGLPLWWNEYDTNKDGQIGLHEWRLANEPTAKFYEMDLDGDGLLTPDEYLRYTAMKEEKEKVEALAKAAEDGDERPNRPSAGMGNGRPGGGSERMGGPERMGGSERNAKGDGGPNPFRMGGKGDGKKGKKGKGGGN